MAMKKQEEFHDEARDLNEIHWDPSETCRVVVRSTFHPCRTSWWLEFVYVQRALRSSPVSLTNVEGKSPRRLTTRVVKNVMTMLRRCFSAAPFIEYRHLPIESTYGNSYPWALAALDSTRLLDLWRKGVVGHRTIPRTPILRVYQYVKRDGTV